MSIQRYQKGLIYKIVCKDTNINDFYVGSTCNFNKRKADHKLKCNTETSKHYNLPIYRFIRNNGGWNNWSMVEIEKYKCNDKLELLKKERDYIELLKPTLNKYIPYRRKDEREKYIDEWNKNNKDYFKTDKIKQQKKEYYEKNKESILNRVKNYGCNLVTCECGVKLLKKSLYHHKKSKGHQNFINNIN